MRYNSYKRDFLNFKPSLICDNQNDRFTMNDTINGNGKLTYPVGLLTADEVTLAGLSTLYNNESNYLYTNDGWWTMSPLGYNRQSSIVVVKSYGKLEGAHVHWSTYSIRPSISLKYDVTIQSGDGSNNNPYTINE